jgi:hypothetical protein
LYRSREAEEASTICRSIDKSPDDLMNWVHWNNASLFTDVKGIVRGARSLSQANRMFHGRFLNTAHRSTYWCSNLSALSASIANPTPLEGRIFASYPNYLRRGSSYTRPTIIDRLASTCGANKSTVREEMMPILSALMSAEEKVGDPSDFTISLSLGFTAEEHASLAGLPLSRRSTKDLIANYNESQTKLLERRDEIQPLPPMEQQIEEKEQTIQEKDPGQTKLF